MTQFRSRDEQVAIMDQFIRTGPISPYLAGWIGAQLRAAEARGAAEERGKGRKLSRDEIASLVEGMSVSVDVSTGDHDAGNRLFGTVDETQYQSGDKNDLTLLVTAPEPNFKPSNVAALEARIAELEVIEATLRNSMMCIRYVIENDDKGIISDTLWMPDGIETVVDHIGAALKREGGV